jgi:hypothetical protein
MMVREASPENVDVVPMSQPSSVPGRFKRSGSEPLNPDPMKIEVSEFKGSDLETSVSKALTRKPKIHPLNPRVPLDP